MTEETAVKEIKLSANAKKIVDGIEQMSVLELADLVKALEDKFGVVAAAPMMGQAMPAGAAAGAAAADEAPATVSVILKSCGDKKIQILKAVREVTGLGLKEAKELVDSVPKPVKEHISKEEAESMKKILVEQGAEIEIK